MVVASSASRMRFMDLKKARGASPLTAPPSDEAPGVTGRTVQRVVRCAVRVTPRGSWLRELWRTR